MRAELGCCLVTVKDKIVEWLQKWNIRLEFSPAITFFGWLTVSFGKISWDSNNWSNKEKEIIANKLRETVKVSLDEYVELLKEEISGKTNEQVEIIVEKVKKINKGQFKIVNEKLDRIEEKVDRIGDVLSHQEVTESGKRDLDNLVKLYCHNCYNYEETAKLDDVGDVIEDKDVALQQIFIDMDVNLLKYKGVEIKYDPRVHRSVNYELWGTKIELGEGIGALALLLNDSIQSFVIVGGPGTGKSTLCQYVAQGYRARIIGRLNDFGENAEKFEKGVSRVPFRVLLRKYNEWIASRSESDISKSDSLFHYLAEQVSQKSSGRNANPENIHEIVKAYPVILMLDGLDEVPEKKSRARILKNIALFVEQVRDVFGGNLRVIATTRPYGYSEEFNPENYLHVNLERLSKQKAVQYADLWTRARERNPDEVKRILDTLDICMNDEIIKALTQTPLQITILLFIIRLYGTPPKQREELFEKYTDVIYIREQKKCLELLRTNKDTIYGLHKYLAYLLHRRAEKEKSVLMDISEFKDIVEEYLLHIDPIINKKELEAKVEQIIEEARQRLVLIESPEEGKVGFGLTTIREFFAACHLVDTAKDTKERYKRFKAIIRSPHWHNVALFFAGRIGRTLEGETPSMIYACHEIDTENIDRFLNRGAEFVIEMVDDHVFRKPYTEALAIENGLKLMDRGFFDGPHDFLKRLENFREDYKEVIIRPWMEDRLRTVIPENLELYADIYWGLFGSSETLRTAIKRASESDSKEVKLWALSQAFKNIIIEEWVIKLLEELVDTIPTQKLAPALGNHWPYLKFYLNYPLSQKVRVTLANALLAGNEPEIPEVFEQKKFSPNEVDKLPKIEFGGKHSKSFLYLGAIAILLIIRFQFQAEIGIGHPVELIFPKIINPNVKAIINKNANSIRDFCKTFAEENDSFTCLMIALFEFLLEPNNPEKYKIILKKLQEKENQTPWLEEMSISILGQLPEDEEEYEEYHKALYTLYEYLKSEEQNKELEEIKELINRESENIRDHPQKTYVLD